MKVKDCNGKLIVVDMYSCNDTIVNDIEGVKAELTQACEKYKMALCQIVINEDAESNEYSVVAVCKRGHVTLHVYKELGFVTADVFSCFDDAKPADLSRSLRMFFQTDKAKITLLDRGDFGSVADMKPSRNSKIKFSRRTKSLGNQLKKIILKPRSI